MEFLSAEEARKIKYNLTLNKVREVLKDIEKHIKLKSENNKNVLYYSTIAFETDFIKKFLRDKGYSVFTNFDNINKGDDGSIIFEILDLKNPDLGLDIIRYGVWDLSSIYLKDQQERLIKFLYNLKKE